MADDAEPPAGPPAPHAASGRRWLRWGRVYVDIEPPNGPNPWTAAAGGAPLIEAPLVAQPDARNRWRGVLVFSAAALVAALLTTLLILAFGRHDRRRVAAVLPPAPTTVPTTAPARPSTAVRPSTSAPAASRPTTPSATSTPSTSAPTTVPRSAGGGTTTNGGRTGNGPITVPEGLEPATTTQPSVAPSTAPTTAPTARPAATPSTSTRSPLAFLGVTVQDDLAIDGARIVEIFAGSGAERAGLVAGDAITAIDRTTVVDVDALGVAILSHKPGDTVTVTVLRNGATTTVTATLGTRP